MTTNHDHTTRSWTDPELVELPARDVLTLDGEGPAESGAFADAVRTLFAVRAALGGGDVPLQGTYRQRGRHDADAFDLADPDGWRWTLAVDAPDDAEATAVEAAADAVGGARAPRLVTLEAGRVVRTTHRGPYADEAPALDALREAAAAAGLRLAGPHTETYLTDPTTTPAAELLTLLHHPVAES